MTVAATPNASPSQLIDARIRSLGDWRGQMLAMIRSLIQTANPDAVKTGMGRAS